MAYSDPTSQRELSEAKRFARERRRRKAREVNQDMSIELLAALKGLYAAYVSAMQSEFDFPGRPWTPERDNDEDALFARDIIAKAEGKP